MKEIKDLISAIANDITAGTQDKPEMAVNCEPDRRLLALLLAYELGDELANKALGDENNA